MLIGTRLMLIGTRLMLIGMRLMLIGMSLMLIGTRLTLIGMRLTLIGTRLMLIGMRLALIGPSFSLVGAALPIVSDMFPGTGRTLCGFRFARDAARLTVSRARDPDRDFGSVVETKLFPDPLQVALHGALGDEEARGYRTVGQAFSDQRCYFLFSRGQPHSLRFHLDGNDAPSAIHLTSLAGRPRRNVGYRTRYIPRIIPYFSG